MGYYRNRELVSNARALRNNMTRAEIILWSRLREKKINGYKFRRQQPIFDYIVDFYCPELKLIIEVDGEIHSLPEKTIYDSKRDNILNINGFHIIRLSNLEIETELDSTINKIISYINEILSPLQEDHRGSNI
jgi:very-short-patch-repair endonuclease